MSSRHAHVGRAQKFWASLGGLGPAPREIVEARIFVGGPSQDAVDHAHRLVAEQRHELRMRLLERALPAMLAHAHEVASVHGTLLVKGNEAGTEEWAADSAIDGVDTLLGLLADEAKAGAS